MSDLIEAILEQPGAAVFLGALVPMLVSGILALALKRKKARLICLVIFFLSFGVNIYGIAQGDRDMKERDRFLREDPLVMSLAQQALDRSGSGFSEGGSADVREPWLILHVDREWDKNRELVVTLKDIMYSGPHLTREALGEVKTICLWVEKPWQSSNYVGTGGATIFCTSKKALCFIADAESGTIKETYTLYSEPLSETVSGEVHYKVSADQVRRSVLMRLSA